MNFPDFGSTVKDPQKFKVDMSTASSSGSGNGGSNNLNLNFYNTNGSKRDPFSFLDDDGSDGGNSISLLVNPLRDPLISLDELDDFINNVEISESMALPQVAGPSVPLSTLLPKQGLLQEAGTIFSRGNMQQLQGQTQPSLEPFGDDQDRRTNAASAAATSALLKSWMVPQELISESANGFAMVLDPSGTIEYVSDTVRCHVGHPGQLMRGQSIYAYVAQADHEKISIALHPHNLVPPQNADSGSGILANTDLNYRRTFAVRFLVGNNSKINVTRHESLFISSVPLRRASKTTPSLLCVARKITESTNFSQNGQQLPTSMNQQIYSNTLGSLNQCDLFSTRLDPTSFRITHASTDKITLSSRVSSMLGKSYLEFCSQDDQEIVRAHFLETLKSTNEATPTVSKPYRNTGLFGSIDPQQNRIIRIQTRSKYIKPNNHQEKGYITSAHSLLHMIDPAVSPSQPPTFTNNPSTTVSNSTNKPISAGGKEVEVYNPRPSRRTRSPPLSPPSESQQKNLLLKQLLNTTYSCADEDPSREQSPPVPNTRILQLLNQSENVPRMKRNEDGSKSVSPQPATSLNSTLISPAARQRLKRSASGSALDDEPFLKNLASSLDSPVCRENPSLVNLLVKPLPIAVPPPVPTKWHQEPKEKLPKDTMRKYLPPHPADRASISSATTTSSTSSNTTLKISTGFKPSESPMKIELSSSESPNIRVSENQGFLLQAIQTTSAGSLIQNQLISTLTPQPPSPLLDASLNDNDLLSEILEGLIDFQEKSPVGRGIETLGSQTATATSNQPESQISTIEKYLASTERTVLTPPQSVNRVTFQPKSSVLASNSTLSSLLSSPPLEPCHLSQTGTFVGSVQAGLLLGAARQPSSSLANRMNELLQVVPPNVSVTDAPQDSLESILLQDRHRRMSSGGGSVSTLTQQSQIQQQGQQQQVLTYAEVVDPREVIPSAAFPARLPMRPSLQPTQLPFSVANNNFQSFSGGSVILNQQPSGQIQSSPNLARYASYPGLVQSQHPLPQQQNTTVLRGQSTMLSGSVQLPHRRASGSNIAQDNRMSGDDKRSLLQKLLSE